MSRPQTASSSRGSSSIVPSMCPTMDLSFERSTNTPVSTNRMMIQSRPSSSTVGMAKGRRSAVMRLEEDEVFELTTPSKAHSRIHSRNPSLSQLRPTSSYGSASQRQQQSPPRSPSHLLQHQRTMSTTSSTRPSTAPLHRKSASATRAPPFAVVAPVLSREDVFAAEDVHRTYSASGRGRCPKNAEFRPAHLAWQIGPGSYSTEKPAKNTPSFEYARSHSATDPDHVTTAHLLKLSKRPALTAADIEHIAPRKVKPQEIRGPLISQNFAYSHINHNKEELLKAALTKAIATPTHSTVHILIPESSFSMKHSQQHGLTIPVGDIGFRSRLPSPSGPTISESSRHQWDKLQVYVPPAVTGPRATIGIGEFLSELDENGLPLHSQARLQALKAQGYEVQNFVEKNRFVQKSMTSEAKRERIAQINAHIHMKHEQSKEFLQQKQSQAWQKYDESRRDKDMALRAERRRLAQEAADLLKFQTEWLRTIAIMRSVLGLRHLRETILRNRLKYFAGKKIWRFYCGYRMRCQIRLKELRDIREKKRPRSGPQPINVAAPSATPDALSNSGLSPRALSLIRGGTLSSNLSNLLGNISPRSANAIGAVQPPSPPKERGLHSLIALQTNQTAASLLLDFLDWSINDRFKKMKTAMLTFRRKARLIQQWWRNHLLAMQWRLHIQTIQFLNFRDKTLKREQEERTRKVQEKLALFNKNLASAAATAASGGISSSTTMSMSLKKKGLTPPANPKSATIHAPQQRRNEEKESTNETTDGDQRVTFATSSSSSPPIGSSYWSGPSAPTSSVKQQWNQTLSHEDRGNSTKIAQRVFSHWVGDVWESDASDIAKRPLRKFTIPQRLIGIVASHQPLDRSSALVQWNIMSQFMRDVLAERLRLNRMAFKNWLRTMRIQGMREELLAHSNTVKPLTREEKEQLERGEMKPVGKAINLTRISDDEDSNSDSSDDDDSDASDQDERTDHASPLRGAPPRIKLPRTANLRKDSINLPPMQRLQSSLQRRLMRQARQSATSSFLARLVPPAFFRLLLTDAELIAMHRGCNMLIQHADAKWLKDTQIHSVHLLTQRPQDPDLLAHHTIGAPIFVGHKYHLRKALLDRATNAAREDRETQQAEAARLEAERVAKEAAEAEAQAIAATRAWPLAMRVPPAVNGQASGSVHFVVFPPNATPASESESMPNSPPPASSLYRINSKPKPTSLTNSSSRTNLNPTSVSLATSASKLKLHERTPGRS